jgi:hypothetical protein
VFARTLFQFGSAVYPPPQRASPWIILLERSGHPFENLVSGKNLDVTTQTNLGFPDHLIYLIDPSAR